MSPKASSSKPVVTQKEDRVKLDDFTIVKVVGRGAYGKVYKAKFKKDDSIYAIKAMKKDYLIKNDSL